MYTVYQLSANFNPVPTNTAIVVTWTPHKPIGIYMGNLILSIVLQDLVSACFSCFL